MLLLKCVAVVLVAVPSQAKKTDSGGKKLRNVIITSFGEMPYEPMESGGYYQSDIIPVNLNDEIEQQTMDVALRTGILVEDPNEKKSEEEDSLEDEESSLEDVTSTNTKRQAVSDNASQRQKKQSENNEDEFLSPGVKFVYGKSADHEQPQESPDTFLSHPLSYGYQLPQARKSQTYHPYPPPVNTNSDNNNREYNADLGEGWSLKDAEKLLKGRNYNTLLVKAYPEPHFRELPPPIYSSGAQHPLFYSYPNFQYPVGFEHHSGYPLYSPYVHRDISKRQEAGERINKNT